MRSGNRSKASRLRSPPAAPQRRDKLRHAEISQSDAGQGLLVSEKGPLWLAPEKNPAAVLSFSNTTPKTEFLVLPSRKLPVTKPDASAIVSFSLCVSFGGP